MEGKKYKLLGADGKFFPSDVKGEFGGKSHSKIYGRMDCPAALRAIARDREQFKKDQVFFLDEKSALAAGYRPCWSCQREKYEEYMADPVAYRRKFGVYLKHDLLKNFLNTVSVSGNEEANQKNALDFAKSFAHEQRVDAVGNAISVVNPEASCKVLLCGHMDEIGFRVTHIDDKGFIHVQEAGGVRPKLYVGAPMQIIHAEGASVYRKVNGVGAVSSELLKKEDMKDKDLIIDIGANSREEAAALVSVGDSVCADTEVRELLNDRFSCRALDDKTGAFVILEAAKLAAERGAGCGIYANTVVGEETTGRGAYFAAASVKPACAIIVDVTWASDAPDGDPAVTGEVKLGGGPVLCMSGTVNKAMNRLLEQIAREKDMPLQYEVAGGRTYTDGDTALKTGSGVPVALVSIPLRYMHSSVEVASWKDLECCIELIAEFLCRMDGSFDYRPIQL